MGHMREVVAKRDDEGSIAFRVGGSGPPLICIPGGPGASGRDYFGNLEELADLATLIIVDPRGSGRSDDAASYRIADHVADIESVRLELGVDRVSILGHSVGGVLALAWAATHPTSAAAVFMVNSSLPDDDAGAGLTITMMQARKAEPWWQESWDAITRLGTVGELDAEEGGRIRHLAYQLFIADPLSDQAQAFLRRLTAVKANPAVSAAYNADVAAGAINALRFAAIGTSVLVITGELDPTTGGGVFAAATAAAVEGADLVVVPNAGHGLWFEAPDVLRAEIAARLPA